MPEFLIILVHWKAIRNGEKKSNGERTFDERSFDEKSFGLKSPELKRLM